MSWFRVDDGFPEHPKLERLEENPRLYMAAITVWVVMGADCSRRLTDGAVTRARLTKVLHAIGKSAHEGAAALVDCGLWNEHPEGWLFHDWHIYNPRKSDVDAQRKAKTERQRRWRGSGVDAAVDASTPISTNTTTMVSTKEPQDASTHTAPAGAHAGDGTGRDLVSSPGSGSRSREADLLPRRLSGFALRETFARIRSEVFPDSLPWTLPPSSDGKAESFAARLGAFEAADVEATMRLALTRIRDQVKNWDDERLRKKPAFAFGAWMSSFTELREAIHDRTPKGVVVVRRFNQPPEYTRPVEPWPEGEVASSGDVLRAMGVVE